MNLAIARRQPNRSPKPLAVRALVPADLENLRVKSANKSLLRIRESHHNVARLIALGLSNTEIAARLGYTETRISYFRGVPAIAELATTYRTTVVDESYRNHVDQITSDAVQALAIGVRQIRERLEDADEPDAEPIPLKTLSSVVGDFADRFGYGKKQTNINVNVDFAKRLEAAITRSRKATDQ